MTTPTQIKHGTAQWWVLQTLRDFGPMAQQSLVTIGTHETAEALAQVRKLGMVSRNHDGEFELMPKGRNALSTANKQRWKEFKPTTAGSRTLVNAGSRLPYDGRELQPYAGRPGAMDAYNLPSLQGDRRVHYRTGEVIA